MKEIGSFCLQDLIKQVGMFKVQKRTFKRGNTSINY